MLSRTISLLALALLLTPGGLRSQAFLQWEQGPRALGLAATGALGDDPSAVFFNPAGITQLFGTQVHVGGSFGAQEARFNGFDVGPFDRDDGFQLDPAFYVTHAIAERLTGGLSFNSPWGADVEWEDPEGFVGRFRSSRTRLNSLNANPVLAVQVFERWSVAIGLDVLYATVDLDRFEHDPGVSAIGGGGPIPLASARIEMDGTAIGWNTGVNYLPSERLSVAAQYRSEIDTDLNGAVDFTAVAPSPLREAPLPGSGMTVGEWIDDRYLDQEARTAITFPRTALVAAAIRTSEIVRLTADLQWVNWDAIDSLTFEFADTTLTRSIGFDYDDEWVVRLGAEVQYRPDLTIRVGYAHQSSPAPFAAVSPLLPDADRNSLSAGVAVPWMDGRIHIGYRVSVLSDREGVAFPENDDFADGEYEAMEHRLGIGFTRSF